MRVEELLHAAMVGRSGAVPVIELGGTTTLPAHGVNQDGQLDQETCIGGIPMSSDGTPTVNPRGGQR